MSEDYNPWAEYHPDLLAEVGALFLTCGQIEAALRVLLVEIAVHPKGFDDKEFKPFSELSTGRMIDETKKKFKSLFGENRELSRYFMSLSQDMKGLLDKRNQFAHWYAEPIKNGAGMKLTDVSQRRGGYAFICEYDLSDVKSLRVKLVSTFKEVIDVARRAGINGIPAGLFSDSS